MGRATDPGTSSFSHKRKTNSIKISHPAPKFAFLFSTEGNEGNGVLQLRRDALLRVLGEQQKETKITELSRSQWSVASITICHSLSVIRHSPFDASLNSVKERGSHGALCSTTLLARNHAHARIICPLQPFNDLLSPFFRLLSLDVEHLALALSIRFQPPFSSIRCSAFDVRCSVFSD